MNARRLAAIWVVVVCMGVVAVPFSRLAPQAQGMVIGIFLGVLACTAGALLARASMPRPGKRGQSLEVRRLEAPQLEDWEYQTTVTRTVDDSGLECVERFTLLVPKGRGTVTVMPPKQLTGRNL